MQLKLENLAYQQDAIDSVLALFNGQYISSNTPQLWDDVNANFCNLNDTKIRGNKQKILKKNRLEEAKSYLNDERQICIENGDWHR